MRGYHGVHCIIAAFLSPLYLVSDSPPKAPSNIIRRGTGNGIQQSLTHGTPSHAESKITHVQFLTTLTHGKEKKRKGDNVWLLYERGEVHMAESKVNTPQTMRSLEVHTSDVRFSPRARPEKKSNE